MFPCCFCMWVCRPILESPTSSLETSIVLIAAQGRQVDNDFGQWFLDKWFIVLMFAVNVDLLPNESRVEFIILIEAPKKGKLDLDF